MLVHVADAIDPVLDRVRAPKVTPSRQFCGRCNMSHTGIGRLTFGFRWRRTADGPALTVDAARHDAAGETAVRAVLGVRETCRVVNGLLGGRIDSTGARTPARLTWSDAGGVGVLTLPAVRCMDLPSMTIGGRVTVWATCPVLDVLERVEAGDDAEGEAPCAIDYGRIEPPGWINRIGILDRCVGGTDPETAVRRRLRSRLRDEREVAEAADAAWGRGWGVGVYAAEGSDVMVWPSGRTRPTR